MNRELGLIGGIGLGAGLMYLFDPDRGNRRRAILRDKCVRALHKTEDAMQVTARDMANRTRGLYAEATSLFGDESVSDDVLVERVRSKIGRVVSHPSSIEVTANQGRVTLSGPILASEVSDLLKCASSVKGVQGVENRLEAHQQAGNVPGLQGGSRRPGARFELMQENWSPTARLLTGIMGTALMGYCVGKRDALSTTLGTLGFGLMLRSVTNTGVRQLMSFGGGQSEMSNQGSTTGNEQGAAQMKSSTETANRPSTTTEKQKTARQGNTR